MRCVRGEEAVIITPWQNESPWRPMGGEEKGDSSREKKFEPIRVIWLRGSYACSDHFASHQFAGFYIYTYTVILIRNRVVDQTVASANEIRSPSFDPIDRSIGSNTRPPLHPSTAARLIVSVLSLQGNEGKREFR